MGELPFDETLGILDAYIKKQVRHMSRSGKLWKRGRMFLKFRYAKGRKKNKPFRPLGIDRSRTLRIK